MNQLFYDDDHRLKYKGPMPHSKKEVLYQLAIGLEHIHSMKFIHCDIKPSNALIWVGYDGAGGIEKVLMKWADFGLSKRVGDTWIPILLGTNCFMAPELLQWRNLKQGCTVKSDVFAEGIVFALFLLICNHHQYGDSNEWSVSKIKSNISNNKYIVNPQGKICNAYTSIKVL